MIRLAPIGVFLLIGALFSTESVAARRPPPVVGRWNLAMTAPDGTTFPGWLELTFDTKSGEMGGRLVERVGRARPIAKAEWKKNQLIVESGPGGPEGPPVRTYRAKVQFGMLEGTAEAPGQPTLTFFGQRPPKFHERSRVAWGKAVPLVSRGLIGWRLRDGQHGACWKEAAGVLESRAKCTDIVSDGRYQDFKLHLEFKLGKGGASGVFLRGRYQVQLADDAKTAPSDESSGAIHGLLPPKVNAAKPAGQWQSLDVTLVGRRVSVVLNGQLVLENAEIIGPTGGAIDSEEAVPGSVMLEAEKGPLWFRNLVVTPALW